MNSKTWTYHWSSVRFQKKKKHLRLVFRNYKPSDGKKLFMINGVMDRILCFKNIRMKKQFIKKKTPNLNTFCISWSRDQLSVNEKSSLLKNFVCSSWKSILKLGNL